MGTHQTVSNESSVLFNLRQLMDLEAQRVESEAERSRLARLASERARKAAEAAAEEECRAVEVARAQNLRRAELDAEHAAREREALLLRVRLEVEASERAAFEQLAIERERIALEQARTSMRAGRGRWAMLVLGLTTAAIGAVGARTWTAPLPPTAAAVTRQASAAAPPSTTFDAHARELVALREQIAKLTAPAVPDPAAAVAQPAIAPHRKLLTVGAPRSHSSGQLPRTAPADDLDSASDDPLDGLLSHGSVERGR